MVKSNEQQRGTIVSLNREKGYGFIRGSYGNDVYFHFSNVLNAERLAANKPVVFSIRPGRFEKPAAFDVEILEGQPTPVAARAQTVEVRTEYFYSTRRKNSGLSGFLGFALAAVTGNGFGVLTALGRMGTTEKRTKVVARTVQFLPSPTGTNRNPQERERDKPITNVGGENGRVPDQLVKQRTYSLRNAGHPLSDRLCPNCSCRLNGAKPATDGLGFHCPRCNQRVIR